jgi:hypothetical protein
MRITGWTLYGVTLLLAVLPWALHDTATVCSSYPPGWPQKLMTERCLLTVASGSRLDSVSFLMLLVFGAIFVWGTVLLIMRFVRWRRA